MFIEIAGVLPAEHLLTGVCLLLQCTLGCLFVIKFKKTFLYFMKELSVNAFKLFLIQLLFFTQTETFAWFLNVFMR